MEQYRVLKEKYLIYTPSRELLLLEASYDRKREVFLPYLMQSGMDMNDFTYLEGAFRKLLKEDKKEPLMNKETHHSRLDGSSGKLKKAEWVQIRSYFGYPADFTSAEEKVLEQAVLRQQVQMYYRPFEEVRSMSKNRRLHMDPALCSLMDQLEEKVLIKK